MLYHSLFISLSVPHPRHPCLTFFVVVQSKRGWPRHRFLSLIPELPTPLFIFHTESQHAFRMILMLRCGPVSPICPTARVSSLHSPLTPCDAQQHFVSVHAPQLPTSHMRRVRVRRYSQVYKRPSPPSSGSLLFLQFRSSLIAMDQLNISGLGDSTMDAMSLSLLYPSSPFLGTITSEVFSRDTSPLPKIDFDFEMLSSPEELDAIMDCFIKQAHGNQHSVSSPPAPDLVCLPLVGSLRRGEDVARLPPAAIGCSKPATVCESDEKPASPSSAGQNGPSLPPSPPPSPPSSPPYPPPPSAAPIGRASSPQDGTMSLEDNSRHGESTPSSYVCSHWLD